MHYLTMTEVSTFSFFFLTWKDWKKNSGFYGIQTIDLSDTGAALYQLN